MSYFKDITQTEVTTLLQFQTPGVGVQNAMNCISGEIAVWEYVRTDDNGNYLIKIYDGTDGVTTYKTMANVLPGRDLFCGLFTSGAIPSGDIFDNATVFYRIDYV